MSNVTTLKICAIFITIICAAHSARILGIFHVPAYSHFQQGDRIFRELAARGHEVTVITPYELKSPVKNLKHIVLTGVLEEAEAYHQFFINLPEKSYSEQLKFFRHISHQLSEGILAHSEVQQLLNSNERFDLVIHDIFANDAFHGFANYYKAPSIVLITSGISHWMNSKMGNPHNPAYIPGFPLYFPTEMNLLQRTANTLAYIALELFLNLYILPHQNEMLQKYFPGSPHINELNYNTSLMLSNSHWSTQASLHLLPNMIEVGGFHIKPYKPLPKALQEYLDKSKDGVVYFSMGSNLKSTDMSIETRTEILKVFGKLKQNVLWKWENDELPDQPPNVKLAKWLPQQDIIAHPNVKLFITHGGMLSITETVYFGVPILGLPIYGDQFRNIRSAEEAGYGLSVPFKELNENNFASAIDELLNNPKYLKNVKQKSSILHDQPQKPLDRAIYWIEYVIRHQGAPHLRTAALNLRWYQLLLLDVALVIALGVFIVIFIIYKLVKLVCGKKDKTISKEKKRN